MTLPPVSSDEHATERRLLVLLTAPVLLVALAVGAVLLAVGDGDAPEVGGPIALDTVPVAIAAHYEAAADHAEHYESVRCYCGCEEFLGHRHLYDCFVRADGTGWEAHAAGCGVCIAESSLIGELLEQGRDPATFADAIDERFGSSPPTAPPRQT